MPNCSDQDIADHFRQAGVILNVENTEESPQKFVLVLLFNRSRCLVGPMFFYLFLFIFSTAFIISPILVLFFYNPRGQYLALIARGMG